MPPATAPSLALALAFLLTHALAEAGPIRLLPANPHYFSFRGKAVALITSGEHYGAVLNAEFDYGRYLAALSEDKLNYTRLFGGEYIEVPSKSFGILRNDLAPSSGHLLLPWARSESSGFAGGGKKFDLQNWDPRYFRRFHDFLEEASRRGIVVELTFFSSEYGEAQWAISPFNSHNNTNGTATIDWKSLHTVQNGNILRYQERYVRKLVHEANGFDNVIFEIQNEPWSDRPVMVDVTNPYLPVPGRDRFPNVREVADEASMHWQFEVARWITEEESSLPNKHLLAQNYSNFGLPLRDVNPSVSILNFHYAYPEAATLNYGLNKAISYDETGFLGADDSSYRRQAWNFMLSGGGVFDGLDYSFSVGHEDGTDAGPNGPGGGSPALRRQLRVLSEFLNTPTLADLRLDRDTVIYSAATHARVLSNPGREYRMYLDGKGPCSLKLNLPSGRFQSRWINPASGKVEKQEQVDSVSGVKTLQSPQFEDGIALHLLRVD